MCYLSKLLNYSRSVQILVWPPTKYVRLSFELYKKKTILVEHLVVLQAGNLKTK